MQHPPTELSAGIHQARPGLLVQVVQHVIRDHPVEASAGRCQVLHSLVAEGDGGRPALPRNPAQRPGVGVDTVDAQVEAVSLGPVGQGAHQISTAETDVEQGHGLPNRQGRPQIASVEPMPAGNPSIDMAKLRIRTLHALRIRLRIFHALTGLGVTLGPVHGAIVSGFAGDRQRNTKAPHSCRPGCVR